MNPICHSRRGSTLLRSLAAAVLALAAAAVIVVSYHAIKGEIVDAMVNPVEIIAESDAEQALDGSLTFDPDDLNGLSLGQVPSDDAGDP
jgi:hypothetical protein